MFVAKGSPAAMAGIRFGDQILTVSHLLFKIMVLIIEEILKSMIATLSLNCILISEFAHLVYSPDVLEIILCFLIHISCMPLFIVSCILTHTHRSTERLLQATVLTRPPSASRRQQPTTSSWLFVTDHSREPSPCRRTAQTTLASATTTEKLRPLSRTLLLLGMC